MILIIDNYDSFTYNLVDLIRRSTEVSIVRNDEVGLDIVESLKPDGILISPGPGRPEDSGISLPLVQTFYTKVPILGICLGHQIIGEVLGGTIIHAQVPMHGKTSDIMHEHESVFKDLKNPLTVMRYHSLIIQNGSLPDDVQVTARTDLGEIMGIQHKIYNLAGVQFHPESVGSQQGEQMIENWLETICK